MKLLETKYIKIGDKEYPIKKSNRALIEFEALAGKSIDQFSTLNDGFILFFCCFKAGGNKDYTFERFMDLVNDYDGIFEEFSALMNEPGGKKQADQ